MAVDGRTIGRRALTGRERQVLAFVARGRTNSEIADLLGVGRPTVARLLSNAMSRLGADSRAHAVVLAAVDRDDERHGPIPVLCTDGRAILGLLAEGATLGAAAATLHMSRRTADRRLAEARAALQVERTVEAVAKLVHPELVSPGSR
jgi:DNA-binding CsgD family transcriptional regulator